MIFEYKLESNWDVKLKKEMMIVFKDSDEDLDLEDDEFDLVVCRFKKLYWNLNENFWKGN